MQSMPDFSEIIRFAQSQEGRKLLEMLKSADGATLDKAVAAAKTGDFSGAQASLSSVLTDPKAQELLKQLGGTYGGNGR